MYVIIKSNFISNLINDNNVYLKSVAHSMFQRIRVVGKKEEEKRRKSQKENLIRKWPFYYKRQANVIDFI